MPRQKKIVSEMQVPEAVTLTPNLRPWSARRLAEDKAYRDRQSYTQWSDGHVSKGASSWESVGILRCPACGGIVTAFGAVAYVKCAHEADASDTRNHPRKCGWHGHIQEANAAALNPEQAKAAVDARLAAGLHPWADADDWTVAHRIEAWAKRPPKYLAGTVKRLRTRAATPTA